MRFSIIVLLCLAAMGTSAFAQKPTLLVVDLSPDPKTDGIDPALVRFAARVTAGLRAEARTAYVVVPPKKDDGTAARFCYGKPNACWASIGAEAKAEWIIYGRVEKKDGRFHVVVKLQQVSSKDQAKKTVTETFSPGMSPDVVDMVGESLYWKLRAVEPAKVPCP